MAYPNERVSFGDILDAITAKLVQAGIAPSAAEVVWGTPRNHPQMPESYDADVMLIARSGVNDPHDGGPAQFQVRRKVDVWIRSRVIVDPGIAFKTWIRTMFTTGDMVLDAIGCDGWHPEDANGNLLTVQPIMLAEDAPPDYQVKGSVFGEYVCTLDVLYMPNIDPTKGVFA